MKNKLRLALLGTFAGAMLCAALPAANAAEVTRIQEPRPGAPFAAIVAVPPGYTTYYISGPTAKPKTPAHDGKPADWGDITYQTQSALEGLKATMAKAGLTFGDIVQAHVFLAPDPHLNGGFDFKGMNKVWFTFFGTKEQPNKPARAAFQVKSLAGPGALLEIEFIAVKKAT